MTRFVIDTNVLVSALLFSESVPGQVVTRALNSGTLLVSSAFIRVFHPAEPDPRMDETWVSFPVELDGVLGRDKLDRYVVRDERDRFLGALVRESELVDIAEHVEVCRDPKDDRILELAVNGGAAAIVTGDSDLLVLDPFRGVRIVIPAAFLELRRWA